MEKRKYIVPSATSDVTDITDSDYYSLATGGTIKGSVTQKGREGRTITISTTDYSLAAGGQKKGGHIRTPIVQRQASQRDVAGAYAYATDEDIEDMENISYIGFDGEYYFFEADTFSYADDEKKEKKTRAERKAEREQRKAERKAKKGIDEATGEKKVRGKFFTNIWSATKKFFSEWGERIKKRREERKNRKSMREFRAQQVALEKAKAQGMSEEQAKKIAEDVAAKIRAEQEKFIGNAEKQAYDKAKEQNLPIEQVEKKADEAGQKAEEQVFAGGYTTDDKEKEGFWKSLPTGGKIGIIGGGVLVLGLITYLIVKR